MEPVGLAESWTYIEEMKELRNKIKEENKAKFEKRKAKKAAEEAHATSNSQNVSKTKSKGFKSNPESLKDTLNLSILDSGLNEKLKKTLTDRIDRLIEYNISIPDIENHFNAVEEIYWISEYNYVLACLLDKMTDKPNSFGAVMNDWLLRNRTNFNNIPDKQNRTATPLRTEMLPDWFDKNEEEPKQKEDNPFAKMTVDELLKAREINVLLNKKEKIEEIDCLLKQKGAKTRH